MVSPLLPEDVPGLLQNMQGQGQVEAPFPSRETEFDAATTRTAHPLAQMCKRSSVSSFV